MTALPALGAKNGSRSGWRIWSVRAIILCIVASPFHYRDDIHPANEAARVYAAQAIAEHGTHHLEPVFDTYFPRWQETGVPPVLDVAVFEGHYVLDKAPGVTLLAVPVVSLAQWMSLGLGFGKLGFSQLTWLLAFLLSACPTLFFAIRLERALSPIGGTSLIPLAVLLSTPWVAYGGMLFGHALAAACIGLGALEAIGDLREEAPAADERVRSCPFRGGIYLGAAVLAEYTAAALVLFILLGVALDPNRRRRMLKVALGGALPLGVLMAWNTLHFGSPFALSYGFKGAEIHANIHSQGLYGITWPSPLRLWEILAGAKRGLLFIAPWLALGFFGAFGVARDAQIARAWRVSIPLSVVGFPFFVSGFVDWTAGLSMGPRHLLPLLPFLGISTAITMTKSHPARPLQLWKDLNFGLILSSTFACVLGAYVFPYFDAHTANPLFEVIIPVLFEGGSGATAWDSILAPNLALGAALAGSCALLVAAWRSPTKDRLFPAFPRGAPGLFFVGIFSAHLGLAAGVQSTGSSATRQILEARATTHEMLGQKDRADAIREALKPGQQNPRPQNPGQQP